MARLPSNFDPATGRFIIPPTRPPRQRPTQTLPRDFDPRSGRFTNSRTFDTRSGWQRFNEAIEDFGDTLENWAANVSNWVMYAVAITAAIAAAAGIVITFVQHGFWYGIGAIIVLFFAIGLLVEFGYFILGLFYLVTYVPMMIIRYIFYNAWTLLAAIAIAIGSIVYASVDNSANSNNTTTAVTQSQYEKYRCTTAVLNARKGPGTKYQIGAKIRKGDVVEVLGFENGFAHIKKNGQDLYVSARYLEKVH